MKKIAFVAALAFGLGTLAIGTTANAEGVNNARYAACYKKLAKQYNWSPAFVFIVDQCHYGRGM